MLHVSLLAFPLELVRPGVAVPEFVSGQRRVRGRQKSVEDTRRASLPEF